MIRLHQRFSHGTRVDILAGRIADKIAGSMQGIRPIRCLDVGCGDMAISGRIGEMLPDTSWTCVDVHEVPPEQQGRGVWARYRTFDGSHLPFADGSLDVVLLCDVLHHAGHAVALQLLREAGRVGRTVIVKDHLAGSAYSRFMLKLLDVIGNWGYGVRLPDGYFAPGQLEPLWTSAGLVVTKMEVGVDLYAHLPLLGRLVRPEWQFLVILERTHERGRE